MPARIKRLDGAVEQALGSKAKRRGTKKPTTGRSKLAVMATIESCALEQKSPPGRDWSRRDMRRTVCKGSAVASSSQLPSELAVASSCPPARSSNTAASEACSDRLLPATLFQLHRPAYFRMPPPYSNDYLDPGRPLS
ncbi:hypothetical protein FA95DRAFT_1561234, partial [Auriscalpium vulgare]